MAGGAIWLVNRRTRRREVESWEYWAKMGIKSCPLYNEVALGSSSSSERMCQSVGLTEEVTTSKLLLPCAKVPTYTSIASKTRSLSLRRQCVVGWCSSPLLNF